MASRLLGPGLVQLVQRKCVGYIEKYSEWLQGLKFSSQAAEILPVPSGITEPSQDLLVVRNEGSSNFSYQRT